MAQRCCHLALLLLLPVAHGFRSTAALRRASAAPAWRRSGHLAATTMSAADNDELAHSSAAPTLGRRRALEGLLLAAGSLATAPAARAFGPESITLDNLQYKDTGKLKGELCAGRPLKPPGEKVAAGLLPKCVEVTATTRSEAKKPIPDAAVFGYVKTSTGDSAIANNPDFRSDAGQFATIASVPPGESEVSFEFVAVIPDSVSDLGELTFTSMKAISYPGGKRAATFTECEMDSLSDACDEEQEKFMSK